MKVQLASLATAPLEANIVIRGRGLFTLPVTPGQASVALGIV
jgi:hypothetical protein